MAESLDETSQDLRDVQPEQSITSKDASDEVQIKNEMCGDLSTSEKSEFLKQAVSSMEGVSEVTNSSITVTEESTNCSQNVNIDSAPQDLELGDSRNVNEPSNCDIRVLCDKKDGDVDQEIVGEVSVDTNSGNADPQQSSDKIDLRGSFEPEHGENSCGQLSRTRSLSEGSSGSEDECRRMEVSQLESDTGSSSVSPRDQVSSEVSSEDPLADLETMRQVAGSAMSDVSSYSWMREGTMGSMISVDPDSALGRIRADIAALGSTDKSKQTEEAERISQDEEMKPNEAQLTNKLVEGPTLTLPPDEPQPLKSTLTPVAGIEESAMPVHEHNAQQAHMVVDTNSSASDIKHVSQSASPTNNNDVIQSGPSSDYISTAQTPSSSTSTEVKPLTVGGESKGVAAEEAKPASSAKPRVKKTPNDFIFGKVIGEGSYSTVYLAKEVATQKEFAIKICEKKHLIRERKTHFVMREKEVFMKLDHPFFVKLAYTFQDSERLYYVLTYARNGELLGYLHKLSVFDVPCTRFYTAEVIVALEYLHRLGIIHRDLKPENILLSDDMHIKITDFGTSKVLQLDEYGKPVSPPEQKKKNSFVGTAEYVSPEVLNNQPANFGSDLWALGCIVYQCLSGSMPFRSGNEYQTFQKIVKAEYTFPEGFNEDAKDLVTKLLVLDPEERLGMPGTGGMSALKSHKFYAGLDWDSLPSTTPPKLMPYLPATSHNPEFWGQDNRVGFDDQRLAEIITGQSNADGSLSPELEEVPMRGASPIEVVDGRSDQEALREERLEKQRKENQFHQYVQGNLILKQGFVDKRKGLFARKRMLLLTEGPHLYYVDAHHKVLKGEIPWSRYLRPEAKNFKIFFVHTPNRTYYLESRMPDAQMWVKKIKEVWRKYYGSSQEEQN
ncbi:3-phosphoinositide-dependent protein kinase 1 [Elysia marginata]|uniref:3-phosphoinositide-dependent protein kinase 1 n=1 Tax=Elysia marginata TaxID=1093978 RepID=A0AAV4ICY5_9GAST|nr:3-phosphoinositide-dependent protein kinase 1 [Elysia marginata]